jgi:hypothetical protein
MKSYFLSRSNKAVSVFLASIFLIFYQGCQYYYKVQTVNKVTPREIKNYYSLNKYFILHKGDSAWHLSQIELNDQGLSGNLSGIPSNHLNYLTTKIKGGNTYKHDNKLNVLDEVHLYLQDSLSSRTYSGAHILITFSDIKKAELYRKDEVRTTVSWFVPQIIGIGVLTFLVVTVINSIDFTIL